jgi:hypothetical protein
MTQVTPSRWRLALAVVVAFLCWQATPAHGAALYPTRTDDPAPDACLPTDCSLREAVIAADTSPGFDFVQLSAGRYVLQRPIGVADTPQTGDLDVTEQGGVTSPTLMVLGVGAAGTSIDARALDRVFDIASGSYLVVYSLTIRNGDARPGFVGHAHGGGIHNHGRLGLFWSAITSSTSEFAQGITWGGGGLTNATGALAEISDVTIARNATNGCGGGIENGGDLLLQNVTVSGNRSREGAGRALSNGGSAERGCFFGGGTARIVNTILASPTAPGCAGTVTSLGHNLATDVSCARTPSSGDLVQPFAGLTPRLDADGYVWIYDLGVTSPALDAGSGPSTVGTIGCSPFDQVFTRRPVDGNGDGTAVCDIGAVERPAGP